MRSADSGNCPEVRASDAGTSTVAWRGAGTLVAALAVCLLLAGCGARSIQPTTSNGVIYRDPGGAFAVEINPNWVAGSLSQPKFWFTREPANGFRSNINAIVEEVPGSTTFAQYIKLSAGNAPRIVPGYTLLSLDILRESGGRALARWHYVGTVGGRPLEFLAMTELRHHRAVTLTFTSERDSFADAVPHVEPYLRTLRI
jgi:hypothetical protein